MERSWETVRSPSLPFPRLLTAPVPEQNPSEWPQFKESKNEAEMASKKRKDIHKKSDLITNVCNQVFKTVCLHK